MGQKAPMTAPRPLRAQCPRYAALRPLRVPAELLRALVRARNAPSVIKAAAAASQRGLWATVSLEAAARADRGLRAPDARPAQLKVIVMSLSMRCKS